MQTSQDRDNILFARLQPYLASTEPNSKGWFDAFCPLHDDDKRSAGFNFDAGTWSCRRGCGAGSLSDLVWRLDCREALGGGATTEEVVDEDAVIDTSDLSDAVVIGINSKKRRQKRPMPSDELIRQWNLRLLGSSELLSKFTERRGFTRTTIETFEIGWSDDDRAYTLPIRSARGTLYNVRLYRIDAQETKIWSYGSPGMDAVTLFPESVIDDHHQLVIAEGEWDAIMLAQHGIPAITGTTGAEQWQSKWNRKLRGKDIVICYDMDTAGDKGAEKVARALADFARSVAILKLPLPWTAKHGQDVTDFFKGGGTADEFKSLVAGAEVAVSPKDGEPIEVSVRESFNPELSGKPMSMVVTVVGKFSQQHLIPREVVFTCGRNADKKCTGCPMDEAEGRIEAEVERTDPVVLKLRDVPEATRDDNLRQMIGAHKCGRMETFIKSHHAQEVLTCRTSIDYAAAGDQSDVTQRTVLNVGEYATETNRVLRLTGTTYPDPKDQSSVFQSWSVKQVESSLDTYEADPQEIEMLSLFRPSRWQTPLNKMKQIAYDLSDNVTRIIGRPELHMAMDMAWHSAASFDFDGQPIERGWCDILIIGDARTGKSEIASKLARHYGFGRVISCESASIPGLLGAVKQVGNKGWVLEWGAIPLNDRRLVVMDEAGGLTTDQIAQLSSVRSSGRAEIHKVETHVTHARTRLIWLSNPRDNQSGMAAYMYGVRAIQPLIGNQEDIARFDFAMSVAGDDVPLEKINSRITDPKPHEHSASACHALVRWVWSRKHDDVVWKSGAEDAVYKAAKEMGAQYVADPPLVQGQNVRTKIARVAVAIAARTFSTDRTHTKIVVDTVHVDSAVIFLNHIYNLEGFGYGEASRRAKAELALAVKFMQDTKEYLYNRPGLSRFLISSGGEFTANQMQEQLNYPREEAQLVIQRLASSGMIKSTSAWNYRITPHLNTVLREIKEPT